MENLIELLLRFWVSLKAGTLPQLGHWNYIGLTLLVMAEGPVATLLGAAAASAGLLRLPYVILSCFSGNLISDVLWYSLGYHGKIEWIMKFGNKIGIRNEYIEKMKNEMLIHGGRVLLVAKLTTGFAIPSLIAAGLSHMPFRRWFPIVAGVGAFMSSTVVMLAFYATEAIKQIELGLEYAGLLVATVFFILVIWWVRRKIHMDDALKRMKKE